jgi:cystathionine beta-lyase
MTRDGDRFVFDLDAIDTALRAGAGTVILCNPHNPLGRVFSREELSALSEVVERNGARVIADEVHCPLIYPGSRHVPYATVSEAAAQHSITLVSASKGWNIPGLKCAQVVFTNPRDLAIYRQVPFMHTYGVSVLGMVASVAAYQDGGPWLEDTISYLDGNRRLLADLLSDRLPEIGYIVPEGTYLAWLDCRPLQLENPAAFFLEHAKVGLSDGTAFGTPGIGHVRLNLATSRGILTEIVERMAAAVPRRTR